MKQEKALLFPLHKLRINLSKYVLILLTLILFSIVNFKYFMDTRDVF